MRKIFALLILVLLIAGCGQEPAAEEEEEEETAGYTAPEVKQTELPPEEIPEKEEPETEEEPEPVQMLSKEVQDIIDKAGSVDSLEYSYSEWKIGEPSYNAHVYLKGDKMKQTMNLGPGEYAQGERYDTVYIDLAAKTAAGYCEEENCDENQGSYVSVDIEDFIIETPFDVLEELTEGNNIGTAVVDGSETVIIESADGDRTRRVWLWEYKGIPLKYSEYIGDTKVKKVSYENLIYNQVKDEDLVHQES